MQHQPFGNFVCDKGEEITITVCEDKPPLILGWDLNGAVGTEDQVSGDLCKRWRFTMPAQPGFVVATITFRCAIADDDPNPQATFTVEIAGSSWGDITSKVVRGKGSGPLPIGYTFEVQ